MLKKIKILLFKTITALVLPGMVHAQGTYANVCISPGSPCAGRIADLENQYGKHMARIADLEAQLAAPTAAPTACAATPARVADLENQYAKHIKIIAELQSDLNTPFAQMGRFQRNRRMCTKLRPLTTPGHDIASLQHGLYKIMKNECP